MTHVTWKLARILLMKKNTWFIGAIGKLQNQSKAQHSIVSRNSTREIPFGSATKAFPINNFRISKFYKIFSALVEALNTKNTHAEWMEQQRTAHRNPSHPPRMMHHPLHQVSKFPDFHRLLLFKYVFIPLLNPGTRQEHRFELRVATNPEIQKSDNHSRIRISGAT